ncbi:MAG: hypothetical protein Q7K34_04440 [archaeon]|nr:hypothetical protein [archaeon]
MQKTNRHIHVKTTIAAVARLALLFILPQALGTSSGKLRGGLTETSPDSTEVQIFLLGIIGKKLGKKR